MCHEQSFASLNRVIVTCRCWRTSASICMQCSYAGVTRDIQHSSHEKSHCCTRCWRPGTYVKTWKSWCSHESLQTSCTYCGHPGTHINIELLKVYRHSALSCGHLGIVGHYKHEIVGSLNWGSARDVHTLVHFKFWLYFSGPCAGIWTHITYTLAMLATWWSCLCCVVTLGLLYTDPPYVWLCIRPLKS